MKFFIKRIFLIFIITVIFISILLITTMETKPQPPAETADTPHVTNIGGRVHVFHGGELRGLWIPYFSLTDGSEMSEAAFHSHFDNIIHNAKRHGVNTLFVQVRPNCDAAYPSDIFPFMNAFLIDGSAPDYDPLDYMVSAAHRAGLEFHAWINPYRISAVSTEIPDNSPCKKWENDPRRVFEYGGGAYLDPASADVRALIISGVQELASRYYIDGIHLDDYFYAFTGEGCDMEEYLEYAAAADDPLDLGTWRCENVNMLISGIYIAVKSIDEKMLFGISPQGNPENDLAAGADVYSWCSEYGYVDYIAPQIYYNSENKVCPYEETVTRWRAMVTQDNVALYIGLALYKAGSDDDGGTWHGGRIIASQIRTARKYNSDGYILYAADYLDCSQTAQEMENYDKLIFSENQ